MKKSRKVEILNEAIDKAIDKGWNTLFGEFDSVDYDPITGIIKVYFQFKNIFYSYSVNDIIYNHGFAKALWGDHLATQTKQAWQYHLQQMVVADDPIKYLGENL